MQCSKLIIESRKHYQLCIDVNMRATASMHLCSSNKVSNNTQQCRAVMLAEESGYAEETTVDRPVADAALQLLESRQGCLVWRHSLLHEQGCAYSGRPQGHIHNLELGKAL